MKWSLLILRKSKDRPQHSFRALVNQLITLNRRKIKFPSLELMFAFITTSNHFHTGWYFFRELPNRLMINAAMFFSILLRMVSSLSNFPIVPTSYGSVKGYEYRAKTDFVGETFKVIIDVIFCLSICQFSNKNIIIEKPYAAPPTGARRWKNVEECVSGTTHWIRCFYSPYLRGVRCITGVCE